MSRKIQWLSARLLFYPTLWWNMFLGRVLKVRRWWHRVDEHVILGAFPFARDVAGLHEEKVTGVVNTCEEYCGPVSQYAEFGIEQFRMPTIDFTPPVLEDLNQAVAFIEAQATKGGCVYVHCKAGRGRSATVVMCWLIKKLGMTPGEAQQHLLKIRPHIKKDLDQRKVILDFHQQLVSQN